MATDTVPAAVPGPPDPPHQTTTNTAAQTAGKGWLASMVAPVQPARPTFDITPTADTSAAADGIVDRSAPGMSSDAFRDTTAATDATGKKTKAQQSVWKAWALAAAQRWAKGGGTANKRLEYKKARAQAHQVKESRTSSAMNSGGLSGRNSSSLAGGPKNNASKAGGTSRKGPVNSGGHRSGGGRSGGSGGPSGGRGASGSHGGHSSKNGGGAGKEKTANPKNGAPRNGAGGGWGLGPKNSGTAGKDRGTTGGRDRASSGGASGGGSHGAKQPKTAKDTSGKGQGKASTGLGGLLGKHSPAGKQGPAGKDATGKGPAEKDGKTPTPATPGSTTASDKTAKPSLLTKTDPKPGAPNKDHQRKPRPGARTPLEKSREIGHKDGSTARQVVDHVKAYADGTRDGWRDQKTINAREHTRLDKAHAAHTRKAVPAPPVDRPATTKDQPMPLQPTGIDSDKLTLGDGTLKPSIKRSELRTFKQYEGRLATRIDTLAKTADITKSLAVQAREQADDCIKLLEEARSVKGGDKLVAEISKLADQAKAQADDADQVHARAVKAHDFAQGVLSNVQTRYQPLYQAVVDSDDTKPAEMKFYADRGIHPTTTAAAAV